MKARQERSAREVHNTGGRFRFAGGVGRLEAGLAHPDGSAAIAFTAHDDDPAFSGRHGLGTGAPGVHRRDVAGPVEDSPAVVRKVPFRRGAHLHIRTGSPTVWASSASRSTSTPHPGPVGTSTVPSL